MILQLILDDCLELMANRERHPETRSFAQIIARNILNYGGVEVSEQNRKMVMSPLPL